MKKIVLIFTGMVYANLIGLAALVYLMFRKGGAGNSTELKGGE